MKLHYLIAIAVLIASGLTASGGEEERKLEGAVIVKEGSHSRGIARTSAISILNRNLLAELESFFPGYHKRPTGDTEGEWESGYRVYFTFQGGETIRVTVSENRNGAWWSTGRGDFDTRGDFGAFLTKLQRDDTRQQ